MARFVLARLLILVIGLFAASALIFLTLRLLPGDVAQVLAGTQGSAEQVAALRAQLGLNEPIVVQYADWIGGILHGDLGNSVITGTPVLDELVQKAQVTLPLTVFSLLIAVLLAVPLGVLAAVLHANWAGTWVNVVAQLLAAVPVVWAGMMLIVLFAVSLHLVPAQGFPLDGWGNSGAAVRALILPAVTIGVVEGAVLLRFVRSAALEAMNQDYVRTAAAQGRTRTGALIRHGLPNVAISIVSVLGLQVATLLVGAVIVEQLFNLPGVGRMLVADVGNRDLVKVQSEVLALTAVVLVVGTVIDIVHRLLDPRLREVAA